MGRCSSGLMLCAAKDPVRKATTLHCWSCSWGPADHRGLLRAWKAKGFAILLGPSLGCDEQDHRGAFWLARTAARSFGSKTNRENVLCVRPEVGKNLTELKHTGAGGDTRRGYMQPWCAEGEHSKGTRGCQQKAGEAGERAIPWCFQIIFSTAGRRNRCRNASPLLHLNTNKIKGFQTEGTKGKVCPHVAEPKLQL